MKLITYLFTFILGLILGLWLSTKGCFSPTKEIEFVNTVEYRIKDTFVIKEIPVYVPVTKVKTKIDSVLLEKFVQTYHIDTTYIDTSYNMIVNWYRDTIITANYSFDYEIETLGYLTGFKNQIAVEQDSVVRTVTKVVKPRFCAQVGLSNLLQPKIGFGYKGWLLETAFTPINEKFKFNQIFITKQFTF